MRCDHRFKLVGYRFRDSDPDSTAVSNGPSSDAVLVCLRCDRERLHGIDDVAPPTVVEKLAGGQDDEE